MAEGTKRRRHVILEALQVRGNPAGVATGILDLLRAMAQCDRGLRFTILSSEPRIFAEFDRKEHWTVQACTGARGGGLRKALYTQFRVPRLCRELEGDLLHCLQFLSPLRCPCPVVATVHDLAWLDYPETIEEPRRGFYRFLVPRTLTGAASVVTNSRATANDLVRHFPELAARVTITPHGTPDWILQRVRTGTRDCERPPRPFFLFVGTLEPRKNLVRLLDAYERFLAEVTDAGWNAGQIPDLVLAGGLGWKNAPLVARMRDLQQTGRIKVLGYQSADALWTLYRTALALTFPSLHEGFGLPITEAMAAGLPVLTSNRGAMAEVAGSAACLVDPEDVGEIALNLKRLAEDGPWRKKLTEAGRRQILQWDWSQTANLTVDVYQEILEKLK